MDAAAKEILAHIPGAQPAHEAPAKADPLASQKAAFQAILKASEADKDEETTTREARSAAEAAGQKKPKKPKAEAAPKEAAPAEPAPAPAKPKGEERLRAKLLLAGAPKGAIEQLSDDDVREWWRVQEERERVQAQALERASAAEKKLQALSETTSKPAEPKGVPTAELDLDEIAGELADQFGEEESGALLKALQLLTAPLTREIKELQGVINEARKRGVEDISTKNRARLSEKLPSLKDNDRAWKLIHAEVEKAFKEDPTKFASVDAAFDDAFEAIYGPALTAQAAPPEPDEVEQESEVKARISASALTPPATQKRTKKLSPIEGAFEAFKVLQSDAEDVDGARKAYQRSLSA